MARDGRADSKILICTANVASSTAIGAVTNVDITDDPALATTTRFQIPQGENWLLEDIYISAAAGAGTSLPLVRIVKNGGKRMGTTPPLGDLLVSNSSRPPYSNAKFFYRAGDQISMELVNSVANDTADDNIAFRVRIRVL